MDFSHLGFREGGDLVVWREALEGCRVFFKTSLAIISHINQTNLTIVEWGLPPRERPQRQRPGWRQALQLQNRLGLLPAKHKKCAKLNNNNKSFFARQMCWKLKKTLTWARRIPSPSSRWLGSCCGWPPSSRLFGLKKKEGGWNENEILKFLLDGNWKKTMIKSHSFGLFWFFLGGDFYSSSWLRGRRRQRGWIGGVTKQTDGYAVLGKKHKKTFSCEQNKTHNLLKIVAPKGPN